ncbi:hypothetical protein O3M35_008437 [Rhynocoris fuscipes]|uniref:PBZ-type domain-containing protein n=1 Tax=Rhynocoris fuscipes TaxID=488301 RepID=A0AAW1DD85_9HEMI
MNKDTDERTPCKYGVECYQKNPEHLKKYKHPDKRNLSVTENGDSPKKFKSEDDSSASVAELPTDVKEIIKLLFLVDMPDDFYSFYEFCKSLSSSSPKKALKSLNLELVGPFDVLDGGLKDCTKEEALRHYRYYFDPPEFQTILKGDDKQQLHYGYFRDDPEEFPCFVAKNYALVGPTITLVAGNIFGAVNVHAEEIKSTADIFRKMQIQKLQANLVKWAKKNNISLDTVTPEIRSRRGKIVSKTLNKIGVVVPYDKKTDVGYRCLAVSEDELIKILKKITSAENERERDAAWSELQQVITAANIANDECDFGTSLELGLDMFAFGDELLHNSLERIMCTAYKLLNRNKFAEILHAHIKHRTKDASCLSTIV